MRSRTVAAFHRCRGALKSRDLLRGPRLPISQALGGQPLGDDVRVTRAAHLCPRPSAS